jgi:hypothetical protein
MDLSRTIKSVEKKARKDLYYAVSSDKMLLKALSEKFKIDSKELKKTLMDLGRNREK